jgi:SAM-dependent methyltransferase
MNKKHLGGHANITHLDERTLDYIAEKYNIQTAYDLGCGPGGMVKLMISKNIDCIGIDGDSTINYNFPHIVHDFTIGDLFVEKRDLCWSVEFVEHVEEKFIENYFSVFKKCKTVLVTCSQRFAGHHHVNVKLMTYWVSKFEERGFALNEVDTLYIRNNSSMNRNFIRETGMVFNNMSIHL